MREKILRMDVANLERVIVIGIISMLMLSIFPIMNSIRKQSAIKADQALARSIYVVAKAQNILAKGNDRDYKYLESPSGCKDLSIELLGDDFYQNSFCEESKILFDQNGNIIGASWNQQVFQSE